MGAGLAPGHVVGPTGPHSRTLWVPGGSGPLESILEGAAHYLNRLRFGPHYVQSTCLYEAVLFGQKSYFQIWPPQHPN